MHKQAQPIVIFDSGVGGLSIYQEVKRRLPGLDVVYCSDNEGFPYGPKPESEVVDRTVHCLSRLAEQYHPSLAIIACNTASTISLPRARQTLKIPIVGVVPAIKPAGERSTNRCIGLLATPGTVEREYTHQLIRDFARDCEVISVGSSRLVQLAENHLRGVRVEPGELEEIIAPFFAGDRWPDSIVLGCTHFPLLKDELQAVSPVPIQWIDSGEAIARRVGSLIEHKVEGNGTDIFTHTGSVETVQPLESAIMAMGFQAPRPL
ncbi:MAG: glutamate racemase [Endozoicomonas sp.]